MKNINPVIQITELEQVGMVVSDLKKSMDSMIQNFGIGPWKVFIFSPEHIKETAYYGQASKSGMKIALCYVGKIQFELIEPIGEDNIYYDFEKQHGSGIQHLGLHKVKSEQDFFSTKDALEAAGFPCIWTGKSPRTRFGYFDTTKSLNTILEVVWFIPGATVEPDYIYP
jgi:methylmalonyl-CoA/ethylmalonyl-CoA epimerase